MKVIVASPLNNTQAALRCISVPLRCINRRGGFSGSVWEPCRGCRSCWAWCCQGRDLLSHLQSSACDQILWQKPEPGEQQSAHSLTLGCSSVLCWQNLLDFGAVVCFLLIVLSLSPMPSSENSEAAVCPSAWRLGQRKKSEILPWKNYLKANESSYH